MLEVYAKEKHKPAKKRKLVTFVSDKFENYRNAFNKLFYRTCRLTFGVPIACKKYGLTHNNNPIERYNGDIEDRVKTMRNFGSHAGAGHFLDMKRIIHNFVNPHMSHRGKTPAEKAGVDLMLGQTKLLALIQIFAIKTHHSLR
jgi:transposase-like protein